MKGEEAARLNDTWATRQEAQIAHYRRIANEHGYCGAIVYSIFGEIDGPCAHEIGHTGECAP